ncbi:MAG: ribonuclease J [Bacilli bacterium]
MVDKIKIFALGGLDENGKNMTIVEINEDIIVIDAGLKFPNKLTPGIDFSIPNPDYLIKNKKRVKGYILTHSHDEQVGGLPFFYEKAPAPVYGTESSLFALKSHRPLLSHDVKYDYRVVKPTMKFDIAGHPIRLFQTCHNAAKSFGVSIDTDKGQIIYAGDYIFDYETVNPNYLFDLQTIGDLSRRPTLVLMSESLGADSEGYCSPNHRLTPHIASKIENAEGRVFIAASLENNYGVQEIIDLCVKNRKKLAFSGETKLIIESLQKLGEMTIPPEIIINPDDLLRYREQDIVVLFIGYREFLYEQVADLADGKLEDRRLYLKPTDTFILASPPSDSIEEDFTATVDKLFKTGCKVKYLKRKELSGMHARKNDLKLLLATFRPKYYLPVKGLFSKLLSNAKLAATMNIGLNHKNTFVLENGMVLEIDGSGNAKIILNAGIETRELFIDGLGVSEVGSQIIGERTKLGIDGVVIIAATISKSKRELVAKPDCQMRGFVFVKEAEPLLKEVTNIFIEEIEKGFKTSSFSKEKVSESFKERVRKMIRYEIKREPVIIPIIEEID